MEGVNSFCSTLYSQIPTADSMGRKIYQNLPSSSQLKYNMQKVTEVAAKPLALLLVMEMIAGADGGPTAYAECLFACSSIGWGNPVWMLICGAACLPVLPLPTP